MTEQIANIVDPLIPLNDAFKLMGFGVTKGYALANAGKFKTIRDGRLRFMRASEVRRYIDALAAASEKEAA